MSNVIAFLTGDRSEFNLNGFEFQLRRWLAFDDDVPMVHAFGFKTKNEARLAYRDVLLRKAARQLAGHPRGTANALQMRIERFESRVWPRVAKQHDAPELDAIDRLLFDCRKVGAPLPTSYRQCLRVIQDECE